MGSEITALNAVARRNRWAIARPNAGDDHTVTYTRDDQTIHASYSPTGDLATARTGPDEVMTDPRDLLRTLTAEGEPR
ncbi:hypothetical protein ACFY05_31830 [Microtetraspora fusca]|uniref:Uncharacterized protein n=1 Tax=Microtetraspora fusca TaxID=1997 RepID=A0ABW6VDM7_MICFU